MNEPNARGPVDKALGQEPDPRHVTPLSAPPADLTPQRGGGDTLSFVMDVPVEVTIELGRKTAKIGEVLRLGPGSILELSKTNGEPLDVYVNIRLIARGEAVVVGERYGIRLTEVLVGDERGRGSKE
jgi:flagellar motor switch protein FliN